MKQNKVIQRSLLIAGFVLLLCTYFLISFEKERFHPEWGESKIVRLINSLEWLWYDIRFQLKSKEHTKNVLVAKIDDTSLERFGRWPWSRAVYKKIIGSLYSMGAETVGFDAVFSEAEYNKEALRQSLNLAAIQGDIPLSTKLNLTQEQVEGLVNDLPKAGDRIFASGINEYPRTVLGYIWQSDRECSIYDPESADGKKISENPLSLGQAQQKGFTHVETLVDNLGAIQGQGINLVDYPATQRIAAPHNACPTANRGDLAANARYQGYFNAIPDADGLFRRIPLVLYFSTSKLPKSQMDFLPKEWMEHPTFFPSLSLQIVISYLNPKGNVKAKLETALNEKGQLEIKAVVVPQEGKEDFRIPTLPDGSLLVNFLGSQAADRSDQFQAVGDFSLAETPFPEDEKALPPSDFAFDEYRKVFGIEAQDISPLKGKAILIGPTAMGVYDLRPNPVQGDAPGVYLHASMLARILDAVLGTSNNKISVHLVPIWISLVVMWVLGLLMAFWLAVSQAVKGAMAATLCLGALLVVDLTLFFKFQIAMDFMTTVVALGGTSLGILAYKYFTEERERAFVKGAFEKFVSPDVIKQIEADPTRLNLGGEKKELSVLFSDIRGFTSISERMKADELAKFMNDYLSPMTDVVLENRGTIDKYMGDAIMAIFGAPVEYANHAEKAVDTALGMMTRLEELRNEWRSKGLPPMDIGIGINTGDMSVGNMGSRRIMAYTVMGDSVNLGSRLESINKKYHTHIIVSESTRKALGPEYLVKELDRTRVKGKNIPVTIYEVVGKGNVPEATRTRVKKFEEALYLYYGRNFFEAKKIFTEIQLEEPTCETYLERCESFLLEPPPENWDGSSTMDSK